LSDTSDRASPGPLTLVLRAAFVPEGEDPPADFTADFSPLKFRATLDRATGTLTCEGAGTSFGGDIRAEWHPDEVQGADSEEATGWDDAAQGTGRLGERARAGRGAQPFNRAESVRSEPPQKRFSR
jgi:hypothetical protein